MRNLALFSVLLWAVTCPAPVQAAKTIPEDSQSAVILAYYRIGEDSYPEASLRTEQFEEQINVLLDGGYTIKPLPEIITALKNKTEIPEKTVALTFEGAYQSALENAFRLLLERGIPFTVFYAADQASGNTDQYMDWNDLKKLSSHSVVTLGLLPASYTRLSQSGEQEIRSQINRARQNHREHFKTEARLFSYPYGEYSSAYKTLVAEAGFEAAFGIQSGAVSPTADLYALPRFTVTESYGDLERFNMIVNALPLPAREIQPQDSFLPPDNPAIGFSVAPEIQSLNGLSCYMSGQSAPQTEIIGHRVELRLSDNTGDERIRVNCTMPGPKSAEDDNLRWRWFGMLLASTPRIEESSD